MQWRRYTGVMLAFLLFAGSLAWLISGIHVGREGDTPPFHIDEACLLGETIHYHLLFECGDLNHSAWADNVFIRIHSTVVKYTYGAALAIAGLRVQDRTVLDAFLGAEAGPDELRALVPDDMLRVMRYTSAVFASLTCMLLFVIGKRVGGVATGLIAALLLLASPLFRLYAQRGMEMSIVIFYLSLIVPVTFWSARTLMRLWEGDDAGSPVRRWGKGLAVAGLLPGVVTGLASACKLTGALTGPAYAGGVLLAAAFHARGRPRARRAWTAALAIGLAAATAVAVFLLVNPHYYQDTLNRLAELPRICLDTTVVSQIRTGLALFDLRRKVAITTSFALTEAPGQLPGHLLSVAVFLTALGFAWGAVHLVRRGLSARSPAKGRTTGAPAEAGLPLDVACVLSWLLVCVGVITVWMPLSYDRYFLPPYVPICLATAIGLVRLPRALQSLANAVKGSDKRRRRSRILAESLTAVGLCALLLGVHYRMAPPLWSPTAYPNAVAAARYQAYADAVDARPDSAMLRHHLGLVLLKLGKHDLAIEQLRTALELLGNRPTDTTETLVQRAVILPDLAQAHLFRGGRKAAGQAIQARIVVIGKLRDRMFSNDPHVRGWFDQMIAHHRMWLKAMGLS